MRFSNAIIATASLLLVGLILDSLLKVAFVPLTDTQLSDILAFVISFLVASLIVGYVFALRIQDGTKIKAIGVIVVLSTLTFSMFYVIWVSNPVTNPWFKESLSSMFDTSGWRNYDWDAYSALFTTLISIITIVITFIGLYAGSMLRKPSAKTKE